MTETRPSDEPVGSDRHEAPAANASTLPALGRTIAIAVVIVVLVAIVAFGWALGFHEPMFNSLFKPGLAPARGVVTHDGKPVDYGTVMTSPLSSYAEPAVGVIGPTGEFELTTNGQRGAAVGSHKVVVTAMTNGFPPKSLLPTMYGDAATTPLEIEVSDDSTKNVFKLVMTGDPP